MACTCVQPIAREGQATISTIGSGGKPLYLLAKDRGKQDLFIWFVALTILKNDGVRQWVSDDIPYIVENKIHVWNHQPVI